MLKFRFKFGHKSRKIKILERMMIDQPVSDSEKAHSEGYGDTDLMNQLQKASSTLLAIARIPPRAIQEEEKFLQASYESGEIETTVRSYPLYKQSQVAHALTKALREAESPLFCEFSGQFKRPATFKEVQISRYKYERCFVEGLCYFKYGAESDIAPLILSADLTGWSNKISILSKVGCLDAAAAFLKEVDDILLAKNYLKGEKLELMSRCQFKFFEYENLDWDDIVLPDKIRSEVHRQLIYPITHEEVYKKIGLPWKRGILFYGIPGAGKTYLGKIICYKVPCTFIWVTIKALDGSDDVRTLYEAARELAPTIVFWEDIDLIGTDRRDGYFSPLLGELLNQLDGISPLSGVFTVATTNYIEHLDRALAKRPARFDVRLPLDLPISELRAELFKLFLRKHKIMGEIDFIELAKKSKDMSGAAIGEVVIRAIQQSLDNDADGTIGHQDLIWAIGQVKDFGQKHLGFLPGSAQDDEEGQD